jgi:hypothetical protein
MGRAYECGEGVVQSVEQAAYWYDRAAQQGWPEAQVNLGRLHDEGLGVAQNPLATLRLFHSAAAQGVAQAQFNLGVLYAAGRGAPKNDAEAVKWYGRAAQQGFAEAQYTLGTFYEEGTGVMQDYAEAMRWYRLAAQGHAGAENCQTADSPLYRTAAAQGHAGAQNNIGRLYAEGLGVTMDNVKALVWYTLALPGLTGEEASNALAFRDALIEEMDPDQVEQAGMLAARCGESGFTACD